MKILKRFGFNKTDEMDIYIAFFAVRASWLVLMLALLIWSIFDVVNKQTITMPFAILMLSEFVFWSTDLYMRRKLSGGYQE